MSSNAAESNAAGEPAQGNANGQTTGPVDRDAFKQNFGQASALHKNVQNASKKMNAGLATPDPTPEPEDERIKADLERMKKEAEESQEKMKSQAETLRNSEIIRIIGCPAKAYDNILDVTEGVEEEAKKEMRRKNFRTLGCLLHPKYSPASEHRDDAFKKLVEAAEHMEIDNATLYSVRDWDGIEDIMNPEEDGDESEDDNRMEQDPIPEPPDWVKETYEKLTDTLKELRKDPESIGTMTRLNPSAIEKRGKLHKLLNEAFGDRHFPETWRSIHEEVPKPKETPKSKEALKSNETPKLYDEEQPEGQMVYPWETLKDNETTSRIIGVRLAGRGKQVCIETWEDWRWVRRLEGASECGFGSREVDQYYDLGNSKKLSAEQSKWTFNYRESFIKLHWVTKGRLKQRIKNTTRCANTYCCVEIKGEGTQILSLSSFRRVRTDADQLVQEVCRRDDIKCPWDVKPLSDSPNWTKRAKTVEGRRALEDQIKIKSEEGNNPSSEKVVNSDLTGITGLLAAIAKNMQSLAEGQATLSTTLDKLTARLEALENKPST
ncbi:hypothetical protein THAR02_10546 [Trichoderma harzianum]|uniref:Uncharacterized protein n=1 Tax=Trichoderma harzianum TaxID=5544 RepID=A0A0F9WY08_TRIHA|nr:hypothetical protein THAR02_10546 [Trichoderma harzianum]